MRWSTAACLPPAARRRYWHENPPRHHPDLAARLLVAVVAAKIERLWAADDGYTSGHISGVAIGRLTIGVLQAKPKALVTVASVDDLDFISHGPMPHSVPELRAEFGL